LIVGNKVCPTKKKKKKKKRARHHKDCLKVTNGSLILLFLYTFAKECTQTLDSVYCDAEKWG